jgi:diacylglycerol kinase family enzyme
MRVDVDGKRWFDGKASCFLVGNLGMVIGGLKAFDDARPDDGQLEVAVVTAEGPWQWTRVLTRMAIGRSDRSALVNMTSGRKVEAELQKKTPYELDGGDRKPARRLGVRIEPGAITVRVPTKAVTT